MCRYRSDNHDHYLLKVIALLEVNQWRSTRLRLCQSSPEICMVALEGNTEWNSLSFVFFSFKPVTLISFMHYSWITECVLSLGLDVFKWDAFLSLYLWVLARSGVYHGYSVHACWMIACHVTNEDWFWKGWRPMRELNSKHLRDLQHGVVTVHGFRV